MQIASTFCNIFYRATPTMQASNRLTFKFWTMLTGRCDATSFLKLLHVFIILMPCRAKQHLLQLCRQVPFHSRYHVPRPLTQSLTASAVRPKT